MTAPQSKATGAWRHYRPRPLPWPIPVYPDETGGSLLRRIANEYHVSLAHLCNLIGDTGSDPSSWDDICLNRAAATRLTTMLHRTELPDKVRQTCSTMTCDGETPRLHHRKTPDCWLGLRRQRQCQTCRLQRHDADRAVWQQPWIVLCDHHRTSLDDGPLAGHALPDSVTAAQQQLAEIVAAHPRRAGVACQVAFELMERASRTWAFQDRMVTRASRANPVWQTARALPAMPSGILLLPEVVTLTNLLLDDPHSDIAMMQRRGPTLLRALAMNARVWQPLTTLRLHPATRRTTKP